MQKKRVGNSSGQLSGTDFFSLPKGKSRLAPWVAIVAALIAWIVSEGLGAAETIRVALLQQAESVTLTSSQGIVITSNGDEDFSNGRSLTIYAGSNGSGLVLDGRRVRAARGCHSARH